jgi:DNA-binding Xre family transcriptional regulator
MIIYAPLWATMNRRGKTKKDLKVHLQFSSSTVAKLSSNTPIRFDILDKLCEYLNCQPSDIIEYVPKQG